jgi:ABC-type branched-subunit amino acid transport system ATPase component
VLEIRKVSKAFGGLQAIKGLELKLAEGEIVSVIGPNGAGKTTLLNLITGVYHPDTGAIFFQGQRIDKLAPDQIVARGIARTFQNLRLFTQMTVMENVLVATHQSHGSGLTASIVASPGHRKREQGQRQIALEKLAFFGPRLQGYRLEQPVYVLSYANRRRVEMARAMATGAKLLILDEPSAGMNPSETLEIGDVVLKMRQAGYTVLMIEHKMNLVQKVSDRVVVMDHGEKLLEGDYDTVVRDPQVIEAYLGKSDA